MTTMARHAKHQQQATQTQLHQHQRNHHQTQTPSQQQPKQKPQEASLIGSRMALKPANVKSATPFKQVNKSATTTSTTSDKYSIAHTSVSRPTNQATQLEQDGKRTLIKNQLYLIEQLQLENANLRNERDQLQLENEELKFQLQMISSSNILSQPGATYNNRQFEKLVEHDDKINSHNSSGSNNNTIHNTNQANITAVAVGQKQQPVAGSSTSDNGCSGNQVKFDLLTTKTVAKTRQPSMRLNAASDDNHQIIPNATVSVSSDISKLSSIVRQTVATVAATIVPIGGNNTAIATGKRRNVTTATGDCSNATVLTGGSSSKSDDKSASSLSTGKFSANTELSLDSTHATLSNEHLISPTVTTDAAPVDDNSDEDRNPSPRALSLLRHQQDEEDDQQQEQRAKLVEQLYGDSDEVQAAAIIIQKAFRKHQICKRFRTITEQLRHTCNPGTTATVNFDNNRSAPKSTSSGNNDAVSLASATGQPTSSLTTLTSASSSSSAPSSTINPTQTATATTTIPSATSKLSDNIQYAVGATRAAAWESLSQAANRLAASAAAATSGFVNKQQPTIGNKSNLTSQQQQHQSITNNNNNNNNSSSGSHQQQHAPMTSIITPQHQPHHHNHQNGTRGLSQNIQHQQGNKQQQDPVVAAAINFQQLESIRKRQYRVGLNIFNKHPEKGVSFLVAHSFIDASSPYSKNSTSYYQSNQLYLMDEKQMTSSITQHSSNHRTAPLNCHLCHEEENLKRNVAHFLLHRKGLAKEKIGQYLGNLQEQFNQDVLKFYLQELDFNGLQIDIALRKFSSTFRLPGEAQKIERIVDCFAQRYVQCQQQQVNPSVQPPTQIAVNNNPTTTTNANQQHQQQPQQFGCSNYKNNLMLLSKDEIFILTFAIIMLNTDLHSPSLKPTSRMSGTQFINNLRGVFKSQTINESDLLEIYERVKANQITTTPDHVTHVMKVQQGLTVTNFQRKELPNLCVPHRRLVCFCRLFEVYDVNKKERVGQHQREIFLFNDMLLVTKLARRVRANTMQQYTYRQSIPLQGLYVQLFQSTHYQYGIRLCQKSNDETLIMFNARNEMDQSRFVDDLSESIAEMDEMAAIKANDVIDTIHFKYQDRLRQHSMLHNNNENIPPQQVGADQNQCFENTNTIQITTNICDNNYNRKLENSNNTNKQKHQLEEEIQFVSGARSSLLAAGLEQTRRVRSKFNSMSNLSSVAESRDDDLAVTGNSSSNGSPIRTTGGLRQNQSFVQQEADRTMISDESHSSDQTSSSQRRSSSNSVHSLDSGLFLSRDVSPNQSS